MEVAANEVYSHSEFMSQDGNELEMQKIRTGPFWDRATFIFNYLDAFLNGLGDGVITVGTTPFVWCNR